MTWSDGEEGETFPAWWLLVAMPVLAALIVLIVLWETPP